MIFMTKSDYEFDGIVIGAGHAGIEAALALSRTGLKVLVLSVTLDNIGYCACNPSIGGSAKGHLVKEIDALGGEMGIAADKCILSLRMLNASKGPAVRSLRAQVDKYKYHAYMKSVLENEPNITLRQGEAKSIETNGGRVTGVTTAVGLSYKAPAVIVATGVYLNSEIIIGDTTSAQGPSGFPRAPHLTQGLAVLGIGLRRFKTGTPARVHRDTIDLTKFEVQEGDEGLYSFSALSKGVKSDKEKCYLGYTNERTHELIRRNIHLAPKYNGMIHGVGARYCPSIEDKIVRFPDKARHQFFIEPEGAGTKEMYVQGLSTSFPAAVQLDLYRTIEGFENVKIMRDAYAIEYDCIDSLALYPTLEYKKITGLYFAGQINGTSGYEEAAAQGLVAGLNASLALRGKAPLILSRENSYIGVMIDDLVTAGTDEPYRMMTGRAEFRLSLRQDNADLRLTEIGYDAGLAGRSRMKRLKSKRSHLERAKALLSMQTPRAVLEKLFGETGQPLPKSGATVKQLLLRAEITIDILLRHWDVLSFLSRQELDGFVSDIKYEGYLELQNKMHKETERVSSAPLPSGLDYMSIDGMRMEAREKLNKIKPLTIGQAARIPGVNPADINVLIIYMRKDS